MSTLLQIVPKVPGGIDGVGDYSLTIAKKLRTQFECDTVFAAFNAESKKIADGFEVVSLEGLFEPSFPKYDQVLLHYVNYGFQKRGVPFRLLSILRRLRQQQHGRLITIFHELYASGPPWSSAFWLRPVQKHLARSVGRLSDGCIVSSDDSRSALKRLVPDAHVEFHPVPSGIGEPFLSATQIAGRDPHRWAIFGGTNLVRRSLQSFTQLFRRIPDSIAPKKLIVLGGIDHPATRMLLRDLEIESEYHPCLPAPTASKMLTDCSFAWFNYFHRPDVPTAIILKSSAFAAACAHAMIAVLPHSGSTISREGDPFPGPFFVAPESYEVPDAQTRSEIAMKVYSWYKRNACSDLLVRTIGKKFDLSAQKL